eukprot:gene18309-28211_t
MASEVSASDLEVIRVVAQLDYASRGLEAGDVVRLGCLLLWEQGEHARSDENVVFGPWKIASGAEDGPLESWESLATGRGAAGGLLVVLEVQSGSTGGGAAPVETYAGDVSPVCEVLRKGRHVLGSKILRKVRPGATLRTFLGETTDAQPTREVSEPCGENAAAGGVRLRLVVDHEHINLNELVGRRASKHSGAPCAHVREKSLGKETPGAVYEKLCRAWRIAPHADVRALLGGPPRCRACGDEAAAGGGAGPLRDGELDLLDFRKCYLPGAAGRAAVWAAAVSEEAASLRVLLLDGVKLGEESLAVLAQCVTRFPLLHTVSLQDNGLNELAGTHVLRMAQRSRSIVHLPCHRGNRLSRYLANRVDNAVAANSSHHPRLSLQAPQPGGRGGNPLLPSEVSVLSCLWAELSAPPYVPPETARLSAKFDVFMRSVSDGMMRYKSQGARILLKPRVDDRPVEPKLTSANDVSFRTSVFGAVFLSVTALTNPAPGTWDRIAADVLPVLGDFYGAFGLREYHLTDFIAASSRCLFADGLLEEPENATREARS